MKVGSKVTKDLRALEERLLDPKVRRSPSQVDNLLADEFVEFGSSGHAYDKSTVIDALHEDPGYDGPRTITEFSARELSPSIVLVTK